MRGPWLLAIGAAAVVVYLVYPHVMHGQPTRTPPARAAGPTGVPVTAAVAKTGDLGVYLTGLGTVTPIATVTVRTRVDGQLMNVAFREGQIVHRGELLARIDPRPFQVQLAQAEGQLSKDTASLENARVDLHRYEVLIQQDSVPRQQLDAQVALVHQFEGTLKSDQAQVDSARLNLTYTSVTAPITGRIGLRLVDPGNIVHAADQNGLVVITQVDPISVVFAIPQDNLPAVLTPLREGRRLEVDAYDRELTNKLAGGSLLTADNEIDPATGTVRLKAVFAHANGSLFPNRFVNARLLVDTLRGVVLVPGASIQHGAQSPFVYVVKRDDTVEMRTVTIGPSEGDQTSITRGLSRGEVVVVDGVDKLQPGGKVAVRTE
jgi:multidrug efflux system membrane fusion protein